ncbi:hypothetical protein ACUXCC_000079 [Cytobacillus horneckiae]|uniref:hypothetical protein n=1 Tax=Cytobacillus horneckiae TaxID=549687 RepID=UPI000AE476E1|nr:hypothetical protein [Cytobacillus horneckiae]MCM3179307.1 hypothetical protein [Cytobacillus horneckiae]MEC1154529.1 hypothetical protein [Cytobacillus horneckiae]MED2937864.1 hypothetical protein [Cytobacillus horneckiae]
MKKENQIIFYSIKGSTIKKVFIIDLVTGTGIYYIVKFISASVLIGMIGSVVGTEGIKKVFKCQLQ